MLSILAYGFVCIVSESISWNWGIAGFLLIAEILIALARSDC